METESTLDVRLLLDSRGDKDEHPVVAIYGPLEGGYIEIFVLEDSFWFSWNGSELREIKKASSVFILKIIENHYFDLEHIQSILVIAQEMKSGT